MMKKADVYRKSYISESAVVFKWFDGEMKLNLNNCVHSKWLMAIRHHLFSFITVTSKLDCLTKICSNKHRFINISVILELFTLDFQFIEIFNYDYKVLYSPFHVWIFKGEKLVYVCN